MALLHDWYDMMTFHFRFLLAAFLLHLASMARAVDLAVIDVDDMTDVDAPNAVIPSGLSTVANESLQTAGFFLDGPVVRGEIPIRIGEDASDDADGGVLISTVYENGRFLDAVEDIYSMPAVVRDSSDQSLSGRGLDGGLALASRRAGIGDPFLSLIPGGEPSNVNHAAAYFPYDQGWVGGTFSSSTSVGAGDELEYGDFDLFSGSGLSLANLQQNFADPGYHKVTIPGVTDTRRQGILLAVTGDNVGRFAQASPTPDGSGYIVGTIDSDNYFIGDPDEANEDDGRLAPFSAVFLPLGTPNVTMAAVHGGTGGDITPVPLISSGEPFTVERIDPGKYRIQIEGNSPQTGVLLATPGGNGSGMGGNVGDNIVTSAPDGDGWIVLSQDPEANSAYDGTFSTVLHGAGQENSGLEPYFNFAFFPFDTPPTAPGDVIPVSQLTNLTTKSIFGWNAEVTEFNSGNGTGDMSHDVVGGTSTLNIQGLYDNRGDVGVFVDGGILSSDEGVLFATLREGFRDNSATGGLSNYGVIDVSDDLNGGEKWAVHTSQADPDNGEININYAGAYFGVDSGFPLGNKVATDAGVVNGLTIEGVEDPLNDGALLLTPHGNDDNFISALPSETGWDIRLKDNNGRLEGGSDEFNYVYLPYDSENLVAGRVAPDGSLLNSTNPEGFQLSLEMIDLEGDIDAIEYPVYRLSIPDASPETGMLLLTSTGEGEFDVDPGSFDNSLVYTADGDDFLIIGIDHRTPEEAAFVTPEETGFYFAYIDFDNPPLPPSVLMFDCNGDGVVDLADIDACTEAADLLGALDEGGLILADADGDGAVTLVDFNILKENFGNEGVYTQGDFDLSGAIDLVDFNILKENFGNSAVVPEPSTWWLAATGLLSCAVALRRRVR